MTQVLRVFAGSAGSSSLVVVFALFTVPLVGVLGIMVVASAGGLGGAVAFGGAGIVRLVVFVATPLSRLRRLLIRKLQEFLGGWVSLELLVAWLCHVGHVFEGWECAKNLLFNGMLEASSQIEVKAIRG